MENIINENHTIKQNDILKNAGTLNQRNINLIDNTQHRNAINKIRQSLNYDDNKKEMKSSFYNTKNEFNSLSLIHI